MLRKLSSSLTPFLIHHTNSVHETLRARSRISNADVNPAASHLPAVLQYSKRLHSCTIGTSALEGDLLQPTSLNSLICDATPYLESASCTSSDSRWSSPHRRAVCNARFHRGLALDWRFEQPCLQDSGIACCRRSTCAGYICTAQWVVYASLWIAEAGICSRTATSAWDRRKCATCTISSGPDQSDASHRQCALQRAPR